MIGDRRLGDWRLEDRGRARDGVQDRARADDHARRGRGDAGVRGRAHDREDVHARVRVDADGKVALGAWGRAWIRR